MSIIISNIQKVCKKIGNLTNNQIDNNLSDHGIIFNCPAVRDRRLYKTAYRMLRHGNFETNANQKSLTRLLKVFTAIADNMITPEMHYIPCVESVVLNELRLSEEKASWNETLHRFVKLEDKYTHSVTETKRFENHEKKQHVHAVKASQGKQKRKSSRALAALEAEKWKYDFLAENNYFPQLKEHLGTRKFTDLIYLATGRGLVPEFMIKRATPWATPEIAEKLLKFKTDQYEDAWHFLSTMLASNQTYEQKKAEILGSEALNFDPKILAEPDFFEEKVEIKHYEKVPKFTVRSVKHHGMIPVIKPVNHLGVRATPEAFEGIAQEIYKISEMPGFGQLKVHWSGIRTRNKNLKKDLARVKVEINEVLDNYPKIKKIREQRPFMNKSKWLKIMTKTRQKCKYQAYDELKEFHEICREADIINKEAAEMTKDDCMKEIKKDLMKIAMVAPKAANVFLFTRYENLVKKTDIPPYALKRYQSILRAATLKEDIYACLNYHFEKRSQYLKRHYYTHKGMEDY
jgi:hypothetical protein